MKNNFMVLKIWFVILLLIQIANAGQSDSDKNISYGIKDLYGEELPENTTCRDYSIGLDDTLKKNIKNLSVFAFCSYSLDSAIKTLEANGVCAYYSNIFNKYAIGQYTHEEHKMFSSAASRFKYYCPTFFGNTDNKVKKISDDYEKGIRKLEADKFAAAAMELSKINLKDIPPEDELNYLKKFIKFGLYDNALELTRLRLKRLGRDDIETLADFRYGLDSKTDSFRKISMDNTIKSIELYRQKYPLSGGQIPYVEDKQMNESVCDAVSTLLRQSDFVQKYNFRGKSSDVYELCRVIGNVKLNTDLYFKPEKPFIGIDAKNTDMLLVCLWNKKYRFDTLASSNGHSVSMNGLLDYVAMSLNTPNNSAATKKLQESLGELHYILDPKMISQGINYLVVIVYEKELLLPKSYSVYKKNISFKYDYSVAFDGRKIQEKTVDEEEHRSGARIRHFKIIPFYADVGPFDSIKITMLDSVPVKDGDTIKHAISKLQDRLKKYAGSVIINP